jgi:hypothetical protein
MRHRTEWGTEAMTAGGSLQTNKTNKQENMFVIRGHKAPYGGGEGGGGWGG